ncbi:MAG TPA: hypothetical protein VFN22_10475 [Gemmatimonadales bacterium]|nr:hypothetical protein [Gemmatimonadales bacterium]
MGPEEAIVMLFLVSGGVIATLGLLLARAKGRIHEMERALGVSAQPAFRRAREAESRGEVRIDQLEHQVDQIASQMERLAESQDFLSRIMSDKLDRLADQRMDTPH